MAQSSGGIPVAVQSAASPQEVSGFAVSAAAVDPKFLVDPEKALIIRNTSVLNHYFRVTDPCKDPDVPPGATKPPVDSLRKWGFGYLMTQMANQSSTKITASDFAKKWLAEWAKKQTINGDLVDEHGIGSTLIPVAEVIRQQWDSLSKAQGAKNGALKMNRAPFRLLAIVNRIDKRDNLAFGGGLAGELRFVFSALDMFAREKEGGPCKSLNTSPSNPKETRPPFEDEGITNVILEFAVDKTTQAEVKAWGQKWMDLNKLDINSSAYRTALEAITESVVKAGVGSAKGRANGSALNTLRTSESPNDRIWDLREFAIDKNSHLLKATTVANTPAFSLNDIYFDPAADTLGSDVTYDLPHWVDRKRDSVYSEKHKIPLSFPTSQGYQHTAFRGSHVFIATRKDVFRPWWLSESGMEPDLRFHFAINTCNGCHSSELDFGGTIQNLFHIQGRHWNSQAQLSQFLLGGVQGEFSTTPFQSPDQQDPSITRNFGDLNRRRQDLAALMSSTSLSALSFQPLNRTH
jgi:hypothetical protein